jgi:hypothetical protein
MAFHILTFILFQIAPLSPPEKFASYKKLKSFAGFKDPLGSNSTDKQTTAKVSFEDSFDDAHGIKLYSAVL